MNKSKRSMRMEDYDPNAKEVIQPKEEIQPKPEVKKQPVNDNDFFDVIDGLPTGGKLYEEGTEIKARPLKVAEVKMLAGMTEATANNVVNDILQRAVRGIEIDNLYTADKLYIMFWLRANTYKESGYEVKFECPLCNSNSQYAFELDALNIKELSDDDIDKLDQQFELPNGDKIKFKLLTIKDENDNEKFLKQNKNSMLLFDEEILGVCRMIKDVNGEKQGMIDKYMYLTEKLSPVDYAYLESYLEKSSVGLEPTIDVKCQKCGGASDTMLPFRPDFFLPKVRV